MKMNLLKAMLSRVPHITATEASGRIKTGDAILVDVRDYHETSKGVLESARVLALSDLNGSRRVWGPFLATDGDKEIIVYCGAGVRSCVAGHELLAAGFRASNGGSFSDWTAAGWPVVPPNGPETSMA